MTIVLWVVQALLALGFLLAGVSKLTQPIATLSKRMGWVTVVPAWQVRGIGLAETLGAIGLILPGVTGIAPLLTVAAAAGLLIVMVGAAVFRSVRREGAQAVVPTLVLGALALVIIVGRLTVAPLA
ncbi:MAG: DoxX family protein [Ktedonobacterales bacterium]